MNYLRYQIFIYLNIYKMDFYIVIIFHYFFLIFDWKITNYVYIRMI